MSTNRSCGQSEPAQPLLPGINLARLLLNPAELDSLHRDSSSGSRLSPNLQVVGPAPRAVPPSSNTGVHHDSSNRGAAVVNQLPEGHAD